MENRIFIDEINKKHQFEKEAILQKKHDQKAILQKFIEDNKYYDVKKYERVLKMCWKGLNYLISFLKKRFLTNKKYHYM